jgi:hypothetical protein
MENIPTWKRKLITNMHTKKPKIGGKNQLK